MFQSVFSIMITPEGIDYCTENNVKAFNLGSNIGTITTYSYQRQYLHLWTLRQAQLFQTYNIANAFHRESILLNGGTVKQICSYKICNTLSAKNDKSSVTYHTL